MQNRKIDGGKPFDWGRTSDDYAKYRDIYPPIFYKKILDLGLCISGQKVLDLGISQISGGSRTSVGGYAEEEAEEDRWIL